jgi:hypothetical protein
MRQHLGAVLPWLASRRHLIGDLAFYAPASVLLLFGLLTMLRGAVPVDADGLWVFSFAHDILTGTPIRGWKLSALPLYFPDLLSVLTWSSLGLDVGRATLAHGMMCWLLIGLGIAWGARACGVPWRRACRLGFFALLIYVFVHCGGGQLATFQSPFSHGGATLGSFLGVIFIGCALRTGYRIPGALAATLCLGLLVASDRLVIAQFVVPALTVALLFLGFRWAPRNRLLCTLGLLCLGLALGWLITRSMSWFMGLEPAGLPSNYSWAGARRTFSRFVEDMGNVAAARRLTFASVVPPTLLVLSRVLAGARRRFHLCRAEPVCALDTTTEWWIACSGLMVLIGTAGAVIATHAWVGFVTLRYVLPLIVLPLAFATVVFASRLPPISNRFARALEVSLLAVVTLVTGQIAAAETSVEARLYGPRYACLDSYARRQGLHAGFADYWNARPSMVSSRAGLTLVHVDSQMRPARWLNNLFWYSRGYWRTSEGRPRSDFVLANTVDQGWLKARFGVPRATETCFGMLIWVYDRPADLEFRNYLRTYVARATGDHEGWWESPTLSAVQSEPRGSIGFEGREGVVLEFPAVPANVMEIVSSTKKPLELIYRRQGRDLAHQQVTFEGQPRRLFALPASLGSTGFDSIFVQGRPGSHYELEDATLMRDPYAEPARP